MRHKHILACICCMICVTSCQNESKELPSSMAELSMSVIAHIGEPPTLIGRYAGQDLNSVEFTAGDSIGIFMDEEDVVRWDYGSISWIPEKKTYWPEKENDHTFRAFYPYTDATSYDDIPMPSLLEQNGKMEELYKYDFLAATTTQSYGEDGTVYFHGKDNSFQHKSSLIHLQLNAVEDLANATVTKISISGSNIVAPSTYSFTNGVSLSSNSLSNLLVISPNQNMKAGNATYYMIVNEKLDATSVVTLTIEYMVGDQLYIAQKSGFSDNKFQSGMQHSFSITIKNRTLTITGGEISPWDSGEDIEDIIIDAQNPTT